MQASTKAFFKIPVASTHVCIFLPPLNVHTHTTYGQNLIGCIRTMFQMQQLDFTHSDSEVMSHRGCDLHFPNDE